MRKLSKIKLNVLSEQNLNEKEMNELSGGCGGGKGGNCKCNCNTTTPPVVDPSACIDVTGEQLDVEENGTGIENPTTDCKQNGFGKGSCGGKR